MAQSKPSWWPTNKGALETAFRLDVALRRRGRKAIEVLAFARQLSRKRGSSATITQAMFYKTMRGGSATSDRGKLVREAAAKLTGRSVKFLFGPADRDRVTPSRSRH